ncbi:MAG: hypothetical protein HS126_11025 [Anaerolineales bacterium]|nr:hypothetical protein [Anaerolineales bacterium]
MELLLIFPGEEWGRSLVASGQEVDKEADSFLEALTCKHIKGVNGSIKTVPSLGKKGWRVGRPNGNFYFSF